MSEEAAERMKLGPSNNTPELESSHQGLSQRPGYLSSTCSPGPKSESKSESSRRDSVQFLHVKNDDIKIKNVSIGHDDSFRDFIQWFDVFVYS